MDLQKQIINCINLSLFGRSVLPVKELASQTELFALSKKHNITQIVGEGMLRSGDYESLIPEFANLGIKYLYQYAQQSAELEHIVCALEEKGYPFILLKGAKMRNFYEQPHMRTSCDIDILTRESDETIYAFMESLGYVFSVDGGTTLNFTKAPVVEFEMHRRLFADQKAFCGYFNDIWDRSVPLKEGSVERLLTEEDFYVYMLAHLAKHVDHYGCGIRPFIDVYLYHRKMPANFDLKKARAILKDIGLLNFEQRVCSLTKAWFDTGVLTDTDIKLTDFILGAGIYGNQRIKRGLQAGKTGDGRKGRLKLMLHHFFPPIRIMRPMYPCLLKCPLLLPVAWIARCFKLIFFGREKAAKEMEKIKGIDDQFVSQLTEIIWELGLAKDQKK